MEEEQIKVSGNFYFEQQQFALTPLLPWSTSLVLKAVTSKQKVR